MKETACMKIMRQTAAEDRIIHRLPQPLLPSATPYRNIDFDNEVKDACLSERSVRLGLKISKAIFVGDVGVGKTCLVNQFCHEIFDANYKATIGVDFEVERFDILNVPFNLQIWDTAGQERFRCLASAYYRGSQVIVIVFDISNLLSLQNCSMWYEETHKNNYKDPVVFLVGTKKDLVSDATYNIVEKEAVILANKLHAEYWSVSSKTGENVKDFFFRLAALAFNFSVLRELVSPTRKEISEDFVRRLLRDEASSNHELQAAPTTVKVKLDGDLRAMPSTRKTFQELPDQDVNPSPPEWHADSAIIRDLSVCKKSVNS